jgi:hypothetical protein
MIAFCSAQLPRRTCHLILCGQLAGHCRVTSEFTSTIMGPSGLFVGVESQDPSVGGHNVSTFRR